MQKLELIEMVNNKMKVIFVREKQKKFLKGRLFVAISTKMLGSFKALLMK